MRGDGRKVGTRVFGVLGLCRRVRLVCEPITPGFRDYLGANFYLLAGIDLPVTHPEPFAYQPTVGIMKVF